MFSDSSSRRKRQERRRPLVAAASTAVVAYTAYRVYDYFYRSHEDNEDTNENTDRTVSSWLSSLFYGEEPTPPATGAPSKTTNRRQLDPRTRHRLAKQLILNCRRETIKAYTTCWPAVQTTIEAGTNTSELTKELKNLRTLPAGETADRQALLWQQIQTETITRFITTMYATFLLVLSLTMQLNWAGGQVFRKGNDDSTEAGAESAKMAQRVMMQTHDYFVNEGLPVLLAAVRRAVEIATDDWKPTTFLTVAEIEKIFGLVDLYLERGYPPSKKHSRNWVRLLFPNADHNMEGVEGESAEMLDCLWDLAESPTWTDAHTQALDTSKRFFRDHGWAPVFDKAPRQPSETGELPKLPLATLMPIFKSSCGLVSVQTPITNGNAMHSTTTLNEFMAKLQKLPTVMELGDVSFQDWQ